MNADRNTDLKGRIRIWTDLKRRIRIHNTLAYGNCERRYVWYLCVCLVPMLQRFWVKSSRLHVTRSTLKGYGYRTLRYQLQTNGKTKRSHGRNRYCCDTQILVPVRIDSMLGYPTSSVVEPHHVDADPDADPDSTYHPDADPGSDFYLMLIRIRIFTLMRIRIQILASKKG